MERNMCVLIVLVAVVTFSCMVQRCSAQYYTVVVGTPTTGTLNYGRGYRNNGWSGYNSYWPYNRWINNGNNGYGRYRYNNGYNNVNAYSNGGYRVVYVNG
ncbi:uncharacterized protein LOC129598313 [Paramacrobiotus metropolitanus]|uniref:uncharacterized protein LOC129598313 n=1 Tax=Paramacrobiotus metropolitanus TaxID=2943436 RepID=UPI0024465763|nr:uncharacterized protein LOC129598313 [Paramacrobiotus metropolitanus]